MSRVPDPHPSPPSEWKEDERRLKESEERYRAIFEHSHDGILLVDPATDEILDANPGASSMLGYTPEELLRTPISAIHPNEMAELLAFAESVCERGHGWTSELTCTTRRGEMLPAEISASCIEVRGRKAMLAMIRDVSERRCAGEERERLLEREREARAEAERLAREEAALRRAAEAVSATFTVEQVIRQIAESALDATGADGSFVVRVDVAEDRVEVIAVAGEVTPPSGSGRRYTGSFAELVIERGEPELIGTLAAASRPLPGDLQESCPDCSAMAVPLGNAGGTVGALILLRRPERKPFQADEIARARTFGNLAVLAFGKVALLADSERRREELERVTESRSRLMRGFSHDLKNPLGAADGHAQLLEEGVVGELTEKQKGSVARIRGSIHGALGLIEDLLELARAEAGQIEVERQPVDVREVAWEMAEEYRAAAEARELELTAELPDRLSLIDSDASRIRQILGNLISNAVKYTGEGGVAVRVDVRGQGRAPGSGRWLAVDVSDTGLGIPEEKREEIFREFTRLEPGARRGAGLGLAISQRIAEALGGKITVESEVGKGSTFTLWLPVP